MKEIVESVKENDENKSSPLPVTGFYSEPCILHEKDVRIETKYLYLILY